MLRLEERLAYIVDKTLTLTENESNYHSIYITAAIVSLVPIIELKYFFILNLTSESQEIFSRDE